MDAPRRLIDLNCLQTPKSGVLEFDFVSTTRPPISTTPMKKYEFDIVMRQVDLRPKSSFVRTPLAGGRLVDPHYTAHFAAFQQIRVAMCDRWLSTEQVRTFSLPPVH
jgi:hypothetical protein